MLSKHCLLLAQRNIINLLTRESNITREMARKVIKLGKFFKVKAFVILFLYIPMTFFRAPLPLLTVVTVNGWALL